jgi:hypothetical protein
MAKATAAPFDKIVLNTFQNSEPGSIVEVPYEMIKVKPGFNMRPIDPEHVAVLTTIYKRDPRELPEIPVREHPDMPGFLSPVDGHHRYEAMGKAGIKTVRVKVWRGSELLAMLANIGTAEGSLKPKRHESAERYYQIRQHCAKCENLKKDCKCAKGFKEMSYAEVATRVGLRESQRNDVGMLIRFRSALTQDVYNAWKEGKTTLSERDFDQISSLRDKEGKIDDSAQMAEFNKRCGDRQTVTTTGGGGSAGGTNTGGNANGSGATGEGGEADAPKMLNRKQIEAEIELLTGNIKKLPAAKHPFARARLETLRWVLGDAKGVAIDWAKVLKV